MGDIFFVIRVFIVTFVAVIFMQIRIGGATIEKHSLAWIQQSAVIDNLRLVAEGAVKAANKGYLTIRESFDKKK